MIAFREALLAFRRANDVQRQWWNTARITRNPRHFEVARICRRIAEERFAQLMANHGIAVARCRIQEEIDHVRR